MASILFDGGSFRVIQKEGSRRMMIRVEGGLLVEEPADELNDALDLIHQRSLGKEALMLDLRNCVYADSVALKSLLRWVEQLKETPEDQRYKLVFVSEPDHAWQRTSLRNLVRHAGSLADIRVQADSTESTDAVAR